MSNSWGHPPGRDTRMWHVVKHEECAVPWCSKKKVSYSGYCYGHRHRWSLYGHPSLQRLPVRQLAHAKKFAEKWVEQFISHPAVQGGMAEIQKTIYLEQFRDQGIQKDTRHRRRLRRQWIERYRQTRPKPRDVLVQLVTIYIHLTEVDDTGRIDLNNEVLWCHLFYHFFWRIPGGHTQNRDVRVRHLFGRYLARRFAKLFASARLFYQRVYRAERALDEPPEPDDSGVASLKRALESDPE